MKSLLMAGTIALAMAAAPAFAQQYPQRNPSNPPQKSQQSKATTAADDHAFVTKAAQGGLAEVELGKLASEKGSSQQVKDFGQRMATDHGNANDRLKSIAQKENITLPTMLDRKDQALRDRLTKLSGDAFDRAYMKAMVRDHRKDVNEFRRESQSGQNPDIKAFATETLPTLEEHLKMAERTDKAVVGTSGTVSKKLHHKKGYGK